MTQAALSMWVFGVYAALVGAALVLSPQTLLDLFGQSVADPLWPRFVGALLLALAFYYIQSARHGTTEFMRWTVFARAGVFLIFVGFVLTDLAPPALLGFGGIDLLGALWTAFALRHEGVSLL